MQKGGDGLLLGFGRVRWAAPSLSTKLSSSCVFTGCPSQLLHENILQLDVTESAAHFSDDSLFRCKALFIAGGLLTASVLRHRTPQLVINTAPETLLRDVRNTGTASNHDPLHVREAFIPGCAVKHNITPGRRSDRQIVKGLVRLNVIPALCLANEVKTGFNLPTSVQIVSKKRPGELRSCVR